MINVSFHWAYIAIFVIVIIGIILCCKLSKNDNFGIGATVGCFALVVCFLIALVIGGIFIW